MTATCRSINLLRCRRVIVALACITLVACHSMQAIDAPPVELRSELRAGQLIKIGDQLEVRTIAGKTVRMRVIAIDQHSLHGKREVIPIDDIAALRRGRFSPGRTLLLVGGIVVVVGAAVASADVGLSGANFFGGTTM